MFSSVLLCGCYDKKEVEEFAYVTAIGIDEGEDGKVVYTFQISNPLGTGASSGEANNVDEEKEEYKNDTADIVSVSAENFEEAKTLLKSKISKDVEFSHTKLVAISEDVAFNGTASCVEELLKGGEVRASANLCLTDSGKMYLSEINPTLEKSTVRYYELFFSDKNNPYIVHSELLDFYISASDGAWDSVLPCVDQYGFCGMGIFDDWRLCDVLSREEMAVYNMLCGELKDIRSVDGYGVESVAKPRLHADISGNYPQLYIDIKVKTAFDSNPENVRNILRHLTENFLEKSRDCGCDVMGFGRLAKCKFATEFEWKEYNWKNKYKNARFYINIITENGK